MIRIAILDDYQGVARDMADWRRLDDRAEVTVYQDTLTDAEALAARLAPFDVICAMRERTAFDAALLAKLPALRLLVTTGMGNAAIDMEAAKAGGITVCGTHGSAWGTAELAFGLMIALARGIVPENASLSAGGWQRRVGRDLFGARLGIVGLGRLGGRVAEYGRAFGMEILAWSQNLTEEAAHAKGARLVGKSELFASSDFISVHLRLSERTTGLIGTPELKAMKRDAYIVNTARAPIIDLDALIAALRNGRIAGAALDVFDIEPLPARHRLRDVPNLLMTPHLGYVTRDNYKVFYGETLSAIEAWLDGKPVRVIP